MNGYSEISQPYPPTLSLHRVLWRWKSVQPWLTTWFLQPSLCHAHRIGTASSYSPAILRERFISQTTSCLFSSSGLFTATAMQSWTQTAIYLDQLIYLFLCRTVILIRHSHGACSEGSNRYFPDTTLPERVPSSCAAKPSTHPSPPQRIANKSASREAVRGS